MYENSWLKQESHCFVRVAVCPTRSLESTTDEQKQVGHTIVHAPQAVHRSATASQ